MNDAKTGWKSFINLCARADSPKRLEELFTTFLTPEEQKQLPDRILLVKELLSGERTQREISADLHISIAKITRGSNLLKGLSPELVEYLKENIK